MSYAINRVTVIGAGTMGAAIAAHLANAGIPAYLLDIVPRELTSKVKPLRASPTSRPSLRSSNSWMETEEGRQFWELNLETMEHEPPTEPRFESVGKHRDVEDVGERREDGVVLTKTRVHLHGPGEKAGQL